MPCAPTSSPVLHFRRSWRRSDSDGMGGCRGPGPFRVGVSLLFNTKARRNMYELETTRALRDRVRAKGATVCDAAARDALKRTRERRRCVSALYVD